MHLWFVLNYTTVYKIYRSVGSLWFASMWNYEVLVQSQSSGKKEMGLIVILVLHNHSHWHTWGLKVAEGFINWQWFLYSPRVLISNHNAGITLMLQGSTISVFRQSCLMPTARHCVNDLLATAQYARSTVYYCTSLTQCIVLV